MMPRYIDKDILFNKMQEHHKDLARDYGDYDCYVMGFEDAIKLLENAPVEQGIVHGYWIDKPLSGYSYCRCSNCRKITEIFVSRYGVATQKYCPNCGAKMDLEEK